MWVGGHSRRWYSRWCCGWAAAGYCWAWLDPISRALHLVSVPEALRPQNFARLAAISGRTPSKARITCESDSVVELGASQYTWPRGVTVSTLDSESSDRGSNPREAFYKLPMFPSFCRDWENLCFAVLQFALQCAIPAFHDRKGCVSEYIYIYIQMDTLGFEPRAFRMRSGCDTTTPCALYV